MNEKRDERCSAGSAKLLTIATKVQHWGFNVLSESEHKIAREMAVRALQEAALPSDAQPATVAIDALRRIAARTPRRENSVHGQRWRCPACEYASHSFDEPPRHAPHCDAEIARQALAGVPHNGSSAGSAAWLSMSSAPRDRTPVLLKFMDRIPNDREDLRTWDGLVFVGRYHGNIQNWSFAAPVGMGGFPDEWFEGWRHITAVPQAAPEPLRRHAIEAADALKILNGHDSNANLRARYGERWWEEIERIECALRSCSVTRPK